MNSTEQNTYYKSEKSKHQDHEYRMKQLDIELRKIEMDHEYRMKELEYKNKMEIV